MASMFDYLKWRGDLTFTQDRPNQVDALIFSSLAYLRFGERVSRTPSGPISLRDAAAEFFSLPDIDQRYRVKTDARLLEAAVQTARFGNTRILFYRDQFIPQEETQFAAMTFLLDDGSAFLAFRGTDDSLTGWKEDFNMSFRDEVPAQRLALEYTQEFCEAHLLPLRLGGHSKGGNLAVYAGAKCGPLIQKRILTVYNNDGPGFRENMIQDFGYLAIVPRIHTYVPQSSVIGMLLEHEEPYTIVRSRSVGILQHDAYSWELMGRQFLPVEELTADSRFLDKTIKTWLADMTLEERNEVVDAVFGLLGTGDVEFARDIIQPKNIRNYLRALNSDAKIRQLLSGELAALLEAARKTQIQLRSAAEEPEHDIQRISEAES